MNDDIAGATLMAVGTSAPEFFTSMIALVNGGKAGLGAGTIIGSAIFNILCIAWGSALFLNKALKRGPFIRDAVFYGLFIGLIAWSFWDGQIVWMEAILYIVMYIGYVLYLKFDNSRMNKANAEVVDSVVEETQHLEEEAESTLPFLKIFDMIIS
jgi:Ca2+/Na+ antiporter